jgi:hypothetical protein
MKSTVLGVAAALVLLLGLSACGIDGAPKPPDGAKLKVTGDARFGYTGKI